MENNNRVKILFITFEFGKEITGGIGRVVNSLVASLGERISIQIILFINYRIFKFYDSGIRNHKWVLNYYLFRPKTLIDIINKEKYDVVHIFHVSIIAMEVIKIIKEKFPHLKIIYSCHSLAKYEFNIRKLQPDLLRNEVFIINHIDHLHLLNQSSLKYFKDSYAAIAEKLAYSIIPNGIEEDSFQEKDAGFERKMNRLLKENGKITVLCMSRWSWGKGLEYFLDAVPQVISRYQNIQFVIAGRKVTSWEYNYWNYLSKINRKIASLDNQVIPLGWLNDSQRNTLFSYADIWVMPSLLEYFPYSILEPMIAGIPIISSRIDCVGEMLQENEECLCYEPKSPNQLADRILTLIQNPNLRNQLADNAYHKAKEYYPWARISDMYLKMYHTVCSK